MDQWQCKSTEELAVGEQLWLMTGRNIYNSLENMDIFHFLILLFLTASLINWGKKLVQKNQGREKTLRNYLYLQWYFTFYRSILMLSFFPLFILNLNGSSELGASLHSLPCAIN